MACIVVAGVQIQYKGNKNLVRYSMIGSVQHLCRENGPYAHLLPIPERIAYVLSIVLFQHHAMPR
jgi:hypothetical protein